MNHRPLQMCPIPHFSYLPSTLSGFSNELWGLNEKESGLKQVHTLDVQLPLLNPKQQSFCH